MRPSCVCGNGNWSRMREGCPNQNDTAIWSQPARSSYLFWQAESVPRESLR